MFTSLLKSRQKAARQSLRARLGRFEALEERRVLAASDVGVDLFVDVDPEYATENSNYVGGSTILIDAGLTVTTMAELGATVTIRLYSDTLNPGDFDVDESTGNEFVTEDFVSEQLPFIEVITFTLGPGTYGSNITGLDEDQLDNIQLELPNEGNYWLVITASDGTNSAVESNATPLIIVGGSGGEGSASIDTIGGALVPGGTVNVSGSVTGIEDFVGTWQVIFDSNDDGVFDEPAVITVFEPGLTGISFTPTETGSYQIRFESTAASGSAIDTEIIEITSTSPGSDGVYYLGADPGGSVFLLTSLPVGTTSIVVYGQGGNDIVIAAPNTNVPMTVYGGAGNDIIVSGSGDDVLIGGEGDDIITGGSGRDLMIGGAGRDTLIGGAADDILIAGIANFSAVDILAIMAIWNGSGSFASRVGALSDYTSSVIDDNAVDILLGSGGTDWFFANLVADGSGDVRDIVLDSTNNERRYDVELP